VADYREALRSTPVPWEPYLREHSGLPGPRGNLELMQAVADEAPTALLYRYAQEEDEYLAACGTVGLGRLLAAGDDAVPPEPHRLAGDERWRVGEAAAMALQRVGDADDVADAPETGFDRFERWVADQNRDVRWMLRQNLTKARMRKADPQRWQELEQRLAV